MKSKTKKKNKNKRKVKVQGNKFILWLEKHWIVEALLGYIFFIMVGLGVGYLTFGNESIPAPLREFSYISPLYLNLFLLVTFPFYSWFGSLRGEGSNSLEDISEFFLYLNGLIFLFHCFVGIRLKHGKGFFATFNQFGFSLCLVSDCYLSNLFLHFSVNDIDFKI